MVTTNWATHDNNISIVLVIVISYVLLGWNLSNNDYTTTKVNSHVKR